jgi:hypothetical protein
MDRNGFAILNQYILDTDQGYSNSRVLANYEYHGPDGCPDIVGSKTLQHVVFFYESRLTIDTSLTIIKRRDRANPATLRLSVYTGQ